MSIAESKDEAKKAAPAIRYMDVRQWHFHLPLARTGMAYKSPQHMDINKETQYFVELEVTPFEVNRAALAGAVIARDAAIPSMVPHGYYEWTPTAPWVQPSDMIWFMLPNHLDSSHPCHLNSAYDICIEWSTVAQLNAVEKKMAKPEVEESALLIPLLQVLPPMLFCPYCKTTDRRDLRPYTLKVKRYVWIPFGKRRLHPEVLSLESISAVRWMFFPAHDPLLSGVKQILGQFARAYPGDRRQLFIPKDAIYKFVICCDSKATEQELLSVGYLSQSVLMSLLRKPVQKQPLLNGAKGSTCRIDYPLPSVRYCFTCYKPEYIFGKGTPNGCTTMDPFRQYCCLCPNLLYCSAECQNAEEAQLCKHGIGANSEKLMEQQKLDFTATMDAIYSEKCANDKEAQLCKWASNRAQLIEQQKLDPICRDLAQQEEAKNVDEKRKPIHCNLDALANKIATLEGQVIIKTIVPPNTASSAAAAQRVVVAQSATTTGKSSAHSHQRYVASTIEEVHSDRKFLLDVAKERERLLEIARQRDIAAQQTAPVVDHKTPKETKQQKGGRHVKHHNKHKTKDDAAPAANHLERKEAMVFMNNKPIILKTNKSPPLLSIDATKRQELKSLDTLKTSEVHKSKPRTAKKKPGRQSMTLDQFNSMATPSLPLAVAIPIVQNPPGGPPLAQ